jgi:hypothetical protein
MLIPRCRISSMPAVEPVRQAVWEANVIDLDRALAAYLEDWEENPNAALRAALSDLLFAIEEAETWRRAFQASVSFGYARGQGLLPPNPGATKGDRRGD